MLDNCVTLKKQLNYFEFIREVKGWFSQSYEHSLFTQHFQPFEVVPLEVAMEIRRHFSNGEKERAARRARKIVASLLDQGAHEISIAGNGNTIKTDPILGADSDTDRQILEFALSMVKTCWSVAIVATDDGGILYDSVKLRKAGEPLFCHTKERWEEIGQIHQFLGELIGCTPSPPVMNFPISKDWWQKPYSGKRPDNLFKNDFF